MKALTVRQPWAGALGFWAPGEDTVNAVLRQDTGVAW